MKSKKMVLVGHASPYLRRRPSNRCRTIALLIYVLVIGLLTLIYLSQIGAASFADLSITQRYGQPAAFMRHDVARRVPVAPGYSLVSRALRGHARAA